ncbi:MAG: thioredoxin domain-containing protein [Myxococcales bacterium]|nr:thioredoxin domain-containing protein [Myxococcales bacterium]
MEKSNAYAIAALIAVGGFLVGRWDAKPAAPAAVAPAAAPAAATPATPAPAAAAQAPAAPTPPPAAPVAKAEPAPAKRPAGGLGSQTDEGAGKGADLSKIAHSPKGKVPYLGAKDGVVLVTVFSDFQCPVCRRSADPIKQLVMDFPNKVKVVFRHNALEMHGRSQPAAIAAIAAQRQGKFWQYHDKLFETRRLDDSALLDHARAIGLDVSKFQQDLADQAIVAQVKAESKMSEQLGASGTPAFFVNGMRQVGWGSYMALKSMVAREIAKAEELASAGTKRKNIVAKRIEAMANDNSKDEGETFLDGKKWAKLLTSNM